MQRVGWDDFRYILAVAETGSLSGAARRLQVNHATVLRRINAFEAARGITVFDRTARGYAVAPHRQRLIDAVKTVEQAAAGVDRALAALQSPLSGVVRVTSTDTFCQTVLPPIIARVREQAEGLTIELNSLNAKVSLAHMDADVAIRPTDNLPPDLAGEQAGSLGMAVYEAPGAGAHWLGLSGPLAESAPGRWMRDHLPDGAQSGRADSFLVLREMAAAGQGRVILPCVLADQDRRLVRVEGLIPDIAVPIWVVTHPDMANVARIGAVRALMVEALRADRARLEGRR